MTQGGAQIRISPAEESQVPLIMSFVRKLAEYEKLAHKIVANEELLRASLFGPKPAAEVVIAYVNDEPAGFAIFFHNFSTFAGRPGIYLEDLFVEPKFRRKGVGKALFVYLARTAKERGCARLDWAVLDWNEPAIRFYREIGAEAMDAWTVHRLSGAKLDELAQHL
jgi:GNAT superfamily N-acetyltransferase